MAQDKAKITLIPSHKHLWALPCRYSSDDLLYVMMNGSFLHFRKRLKLSSQRWTEQGARHMACLRAFIKSVRLDAIQQFINLHKLDFCLILVDENCLLLSVLTPTGEPLQLPLPKHRSMKLMGHRRNSQ